LRTSPDSHWGFLDTRFKAKHSGEAFAHPECFKPGPKQRPWFAEFKYDSPDIGAAVKLEFLPVMDHAA